MKRFTLINLLIATALCLNAQDLSIDQPAVLFKINPHLTIKNISFTPCETILDIEADFTGFAGGGSLSVAPPNHREAIYLQGSDGKSYRLKSALGVAYSPEKDFYRADEKTRFKLLFEVMNPEEVSYFNIIESEEKYGFAFYGVALSNEGITSFQNWENFFKKGNREDKMEGIWKRNIYHVLVDSEDVINKNFAPMTDTLAIIKIKNRYQVFQIDGSPTGEEFYELVDGYPSRYLKIFRDKTLLKDIRVSSGKYIMFDYILPKSQKTAILKDLGLKTKIVVRRFHTLKRLDVLSQ